MAERGAPRLEKLAELVEHIRHANRDGDHEHATRLQTALRELLEGDLPDLPKTEALCDCRFTPATVPDDDLAAADSLEEIHEAVLGLGPTPGWH
jgi:hypothetical protein